MWQRPALNQKEREKNWTLISPLPLWQFVFPCDFAADQGWPHLLCTFASAEAAHERASDCTGEQEPLCDLIMDATVTRESP